MSNQKSPLSIEWSEKKVLVSDLKPYERNPRRITKEAFEKLKSSLRELGYHQRIIAQPNLSIIGGHQRIKAFQELGVSEVIVLVPNRELTMEEFRRALITDNLPFGEYDFDILSADFEAEELRDWGMAESLLEDFKEGTEQGATDVDAAPAVQSKIISQEGQIWCLGDHRIVCGDSTHADVVNALVRGDHPNLMVTDPPYGVEYDANWRNEADRANGKPYGARAVGKVQNDDRADWREAWALFPGHIAYVWHGGLHAPIVAQSLESMGLLIRAQIVWVKTRPAISRGHYHWQHEPAFYAQKPETDDNWRFGDDHEVAGYAVRKGVSGKWNGGRKQSTVWFIDHLKSDTGHSTQKPVMCMQRPIENNSAKGEFVYDPFLGSGTTLMAAHITGRKCLGVELNPAYIDVIIRRWQNFTGRKAVLDGTDKTFAEVEGVGNVSHETIEADKNAPREAIEKNPA